MTFEELQTWAEKDLSCTVKYVGRDFRVRHNGCVDYWCADLEQVEDTLKDIQKATENAPT